MYIFMLINLYIYFYITFIYFIFSLKNKTELFLMLFYLCLMLHKLICTVWACPSSRPRIHSRRAQTAIRRHVSLPVIASNMSRCSNRVDDSWGKWRRFDLHAPPEMQTRIAEYQCRDFRKPWKMTDICGFSCLERTCTTNKGRSAITSLAVAHLPRSRFLKKSAAECGQDAAKNSIIGSGLCKYVAQLWILIVAFNGYGAIAAITSEVAG